ncbi:MAG TPA: insulinase family protein [Candidatus Obscuribacterales bacterium]
MNLSLSFLHMSRRCLALALFFVFFVSSACPARALEGVESEVIEPPLACTTTKGVTPAAAVPQEAVLPNGLRVLFVEEHSVPIVSCLIWYRAGARNERPGGTGLSHLVEHLLFQNVGGFRKGEMGAMIVRNGGQFNGFTSDDFTAFFETVHPSKLELCLRIESERMRLARFTPNDVSAEIANIRKEFDEETADPGAALTQEVRSVAFVHHPYGNPTRGWRPDVEALTVEDVKGFYDRYFRPHNATLVLVGDFKTASALALVKKYFGIIPKHTGAIPPIRAVEPLQHAERRVIMRHPGRKEMLYLAYHAPAINDQDSAAMALLEKVLNAHYAGRFKTKLLEPHVCSHATSLFELKRDPGLFTLTLMPASGVPLHKVLEGLDNMIAQLRSQPITDAELRRARNQAEFACFNERDGVYRTGFHIGYFDSIQSWKAAYSWPERLKTVTAADLQRVAKRYLVPENRVVGFLHAQAAPPPAKPASPAPAEKGGPKTQPAKPGSQAETRPERPGVRTPISRRMGSVPLVGYKNDDSAIAPNEPILLALKTEANASSSKENGSDSEKNGKSTKKSSSKKSSSTPSEDRKTASKKGSDQTKQSPDAKGKSKTAFVKGKDEKSDKKRADPSAKSSGKSVTNKPAKDKKEESAKKSGKDTTKTAKDSGKTPGKDSAKSAKDSSKSANAKDSSKSAGESAKATKESSKSAGESAKATTTPVVRTNVSPVPSSSSGEGELPIPGSSLKAGHYTRKVLKNGLTVIAFENRLSPIVQIAGAIRSGEVYEPQGKTGVSALAAHAMNYGTAKLNKTQLHSLQEDLGLPPQAMLHFEPGQEFVSFQGRCLSRDLPQHMTILSDVLREPAFSEGDIEKAKQDAFNSIKQNDETVSSRVRRALLRSLVASSSAYFPADPSEKARSIEALKASDVKEFHASVMRPENTTIVIAGDIIGEEAIRQAEQCLSHWTGAGQYREAVVTPSSRRSLKTSVPIRDRAQTTVCVGQLLRVSRNDREFCDLLIADCALTNHPMFSRLLQKAHDERVFGSGVSCDDISSGLEGLGGMTTWYLSVPVESNAVSRAVAAIKNELKGFAKNGLTPAEAAEVKRFLYGALPIRYMQNLSLAAKSILDASLQRAEGDHLGELLLKVRNANPESINKFIKTVLRPEQSSLVIAGDRGVVKQIPSLRDSELSQEAADKTMEAAGPAPAGSSKENE